MLVASLIGLFMLLAIRPALAQTTFGSLSNFDVFNDTGQETHGFEIELDGISSANVTYKFGGTYQQYGDPIVTDFPGGVYVRYEARYDPVKAAWSATTPLASTPITPTMGHACWTGGIPPAGLLAYPNGGCEHFGLGLSANPTNTVYRWLIADPASPGSLIAVGNQSFDSGTDLDCWLSRSRLSRWLSPRSFQRRPRRQCRCANSVTRNGLRST